MRDHPDFHVDAVRSKTAKERQLPPKRSLPPPLDLDLASAAAAAGSPDAAAVAAGTAAVPSSPKSPTVVSSQRVDLGALFGLDAGGSLAKLVYFERVAPSEGRQAAPRKPAAAYDPMDKLASSPMLIRANSLAALDRAEGLAAKLGQKATFEALRNFYSFMAKRIGQAYVSSAVHEEGLSFEASAFGGGQLHFLHFETRDIETVIRLVRNKRLTRSIVGLGCTGGGAYKFQRAIEEDLAIKVIPIDEMESLVRGLEFVVANVQGECFTYKPKAKAGNPGDKPAPRWPKRKQGKSVQGGGGAGDDDDEDTPQSSPPQWPTANTADDEATAAVTPAEQQAVFFEGQVAALAARGVDPGKARRALLEAEATAEAEARAGGRPAAEAKAAGAAARAHVVAQAGRDRGKDEAKEKAETETETEEKVGKGGGGGREEDEAGGGSQGEAWTEKVARPGPRLGLDAPLVPPGTPPPGGRGGSASAAGGDWGADAAESYPYLLVNIGSGVSIIRVDGPDGRFQRVSGSSIGGGTFFGLARLLCAGGAKMTFDQTLELAAAGDSRRCDMMVGDIYGHDYQKIGLSSDVVACSFGKSISSDLSETSRPEDRARALLMMVTNNIAQVAYLNAQQHKTARIYFIGNFLRRNAVSCQRLSFAIDYWSRGSKEALFLEHEGYFGALGAFILSASQEGEAKGEGEGTKEEERGEGGGGREGEGRARGGDNLPGAEPEDEVDAPSIDAPNRVTG